MMDDDGGLRLGKSMTFVGTDDWKSSTSIVVRYRPPKII